jgi:hypothetical protein
MQHTQYICLQQVSDVPSDWLMFSVDWVSYKNISKQTVALADEKGAKLISCVFDFCDSIKSIIKYTIKFTRGST